MALDSRIAIEALCTLTNSLDLAQASVPLTYRKSYRLQNGSGANQANLIFHDTRTVAASSNEDLDLAGSLTDALGTTLTFARIKGLIVSAASGNTNNVNVSRPASNGVPLFLAASDGIAIRPGGTFAWFATDATGIAVTAGTGDLINVANSSSGTSVTYDVVIIGASA